jgi:hypothetical protein
LRTGSDSYRLPVRNHPEKRKGCIRNRTKHSLLRVNLPDFLQLLIQILYHSTVAQQNLSFLVRHDHVGQARQLQGQKNLIFLVRDEWKGKVQLLLESIDFRFVVSAGNSQQLDVPAQDRVLLDRMV